MRSLFIVTASALSLAAAAQADFVDVQYTGTGVGYNVNVLSPGFNGNVFAGQILTTLTNSTAGPNYGNLNGNWIVFCCELPQYVNGASIPYEVLPVSSVPLAGPMGAAAATAISEVYFAAAGTQYGGDSDLAAAFQIAVWELALDYAGGPAGVGDLGVGNFQVSGTTAATDAYLAALLGAVGSGNTAAILGLGNESAQDFIIEVPAPGAIALLGVAGLVGRRRRA